MTLQPDRGERFAVGVWLCCVIYLWNDGTTSAGESPPDTRDFGLCPNCGGHGLYRSKL